ncbi:MAG: prepilin-type N-terminal cleavage/methylation domain-containing protein [Candidatus Auribacterota bacterium]|nr:prepilin-type N-terminal cleavage/methylation domain-containing protein [Candidatus Auribacterota bacterium]
MGAELGKKSGFTLLEILLTIVLFSAGVAALIQVFGMGMFAAEDTQHTLVATNLAREKLEEIKNKAYADISGEAKAQLSAFTFFQRELTVSTPQTGLKLITVNVYWTVRDQEQTVSLITYVSDT